MAQGLNFQTHQFNDPTEGLQKALGAGSMFAQSLKSMQDFESEQAKLRMMQQEKDRQARLDAEHAEDRAAAQKAKAEERDLADALSTKDTKYDATDAFNQLEAQGGKKFTEQLYKGDAAADKMQMALGDTIVDQYMHNQTFERSNLEKVEDFIQSRGGTGSVDTNTLISYQKAKADALKAKAELSGQRDVLSNQEAAYAAAGRKDEFDKQMKLLDLQIRSNDSDYVRESAASKRSEGTPGKDRFDSLYGNVGTSILKDPRVLKMSDPDRQVVEDTLEQFRARGVNPSLASQKIWKGIKGVGDTTDSGEFTKFTFSRPNVEGVEVLTPEQRLAFDGGKEGTDYAVYEANRKTRDALFAQEAKMIAANVGANDPQLAAVRSQLAKLDRSQAEIFRDENHDVWNKFLRTNMNGYVDPNAVAESAKKPLNIVAPTTLDANGQPIKDGLAKAVTPEWSSKVKAFQLPAGYTASDEGTKNTMIVNATKNHIRSEEGIGKDGRYVPYMDEQKDKNGKVIRRIPTLGHGINQAEFESAMKSELGGKYNPSNAKHKAIFDKYEDNRLTETVNTAKKQAAALGLPAESVPLLASMAHQHGAGWMSKWSGTVSDIKKGDYDSAIARVQKSPWYKVQTPERAQKFVDMLEAVKELKAGGSKWFDDDAHKANPKYDSSLQAKLNDQVSKSTSALDASLRQKLATHQATQADYRAANSETNALLHPIQAFGHLGNALGSDIDVSRTKDALTYTNMAKEVNRLKAEIAKIPSDVSSIKGSAKEKAEAQSKIDEYNARVQGLMRYERSLNRSYMEENGIPLYSAEYKLR